MKTLLAYLWRRSRQHRNDCLKGLLVFLGLLNLSTLSAQVHPAWIARYNGPGNQDDNVWDMVLDQAGNIYVVGTSHGGVTNYDIATIKYDPNGNPLWIRRYDAFGYKPDDAQTIAVDQVGNVFVTGWSQDYRSYWEYRDDQIRCARESALGTPL
jgi:hypothetical protein